MVPRIQSRRPGESPTLKKRAYSSALRSEGAEATRKKILSSARALFKSAGFQATTIEAIARVAGVAPPTVYAVFQSKARILSVLVAGAGADEDIRAVARRAMAQGDPRRRVNAGAHVVRLILDREGDLTDLLWQAGSGEPALREVWRQSNRQRLRRLTEMFTPLAEAAQLRPGVNLSAAVDVFWALSSPEVYRLLVSERGWSSQRYEKWLAASARDLLLA